MASDKLYIGWAQTDITPDRPVFVQGQLYHRVSSYVRDQLTATALALEAGEEQLILLSVDIAGFSDPLLRAVRRRLTDNELGLKVEKVSFSGTHTHNSIEFSPGESVFELLFGKNDIPEDILPKLDLPDNYLEGDEGMDWLSDKLAQVVLDAWEQRLPGGISAAHDYAAIGHNRRPQFLTGERRETRMYGVCSDVHFVGMEGSVEHTANFLFTWDEMNNLTGIVPAIACPAQVHELHRYLSADYWHEARKSLRDALGHIFILPLCSFAGDQNPLDLIQMSKVNEKELKIWNAQSGEAFRNIDLTLVCQEIGERITEAAVRAYRKARNTIETRPVFDHEVIEISLPVRQVSKAAFIEAQAFLDDLVEKHSPENRMTWSDVAYAFQHVGVIARWERQDKEPVWKIETHVIRLGSSVFVTVPFEMFVEYGFRIRARTRAAEVFPIQLSNGMYGYGPTKAAVAGGSYSGNPAATPISPAGGDELVECLINAANELYE